jgi:hypothetical protein
MQECGHDPADDDTIFSPVHLPGLAGRLQTVGPTLLAYDERMTLHEEDSESPHPERPDRIRAVIGRLLSTGLAGGRCSTHCIMFDCNLSIGRIAEWDMLSTRMVRVAWRVHGMAILSRC